MVHTEDILSNVLLRFPDAKRAGKSWKARCPAHEDNTPSLSISPGDDGRALLCCHAGCSTEAIVKSLGISMSDLFPQNGSNATKHKASNGSEARFQTAQAALAVYERKLGRPAGVWQYHDINGQHVFSVARWNKPGNKKEIRPVSKNGTGWTLNAMPAPRTLYQLPDLLASVETPIVCEGEPCADEFRRLGFTATTSSGGSKAAEHTDWGPLDGWEEIIFVPDNDEPGEKYVADAIALVREANPTVKVKILRLPGLEKGGDVVDFVKVRYEDGKDDMAIVQEINDLLATTPYELDTGNAVTEHTTAQNATKTKVVLPLPLPDPWEPFPIQHLPQALRDYTDAASRAIGCDASFVGLPLIVTFGAAIGTSRALLLKRAWTEPCILWGAIIGESGMLKSPAVYAATRFPRARQSVALKRYQCEYEEWQTAMLTYEKELAIWKRKGSGDPPEKPEEPIPQRAYVDDTTIEGLCPILAGNPRGVLMAKDELATWIGAFDRYASSGGSDAAKWLELFGGRGLIIDRKTGLRITYIPLAGVSVIGGIQPAILRRVVQKEHRENGLLARLLIVSPPRVPKKWSEAEVDHDLVAACQQVYDRLFQLSHDTDESGDPKPGIVKLSPAAKELWISFVNSHGQEHLSLVGDLAACWSKIEGYAARFALLHHCVRWASKEDVDESTIDETSMAAGIALARWFGNEAKRVYDHLDATEEEHARNELVDLIRRHGGSITTRALTHASRKWRESGSAEAALEELQKAGLGHWIVGESTAAGGRPATEFKLW